MKSPRFDTRAKPLRRIFSAENIERVWRDKVRLSMRQQFVVDGIEHFDFHVEFVNESSKLSKLIMSGDYVPSRPQRILVEKSKGLCRQLVIPSVADAIVLQCLSDALYKEIKGQAPTEKSFFEPKDHRFSNVRSNYGTFAAWLNFQKGLFKFTEERPFIVVTDIANYYDSISYIHLRNVISSTTSVQEPVLDMLIYVLGDLLWQPDYSPRIEVGLPQMNLDAPRLLAHCFLYELDKCLDSAGDKDFVRYMDDIDVGVDSVVAARRVLQEIDLILQTRQVRLNSGKTQILSAEDAALHFRVMENAELDEFGKRLDDRIRRKRSLAAQRRRVEKEIARGIQRGSFDGGSGDKVLKRWISLAIKTGANITPRKLRHIILSRPAVRENAFEYIMRQPLTADRARLLAECAESGHLVDDAGMVDLANNLVDTCVLLKRGRHASILRILECCKVETYFGLYCRLWLGSKYLSAQEMFDLAKRTRGVWAAHDRLGRLVGAFAPIFEGEGLRSELLKLIVLSGNQGALTTFKFHERLKSDGLTFNNMFQALRTPNPSRGTGITHAKFLCLLSALKNESATARQLELLRTANKSVFSDTYYGRYAQG